MAKRAVQDSAVDESVGRGKHTVVRRYELDKHGFVIDSIEGEQSGYSGVKKKTLRGGIRKRRK